MTKMMKGFPKVSSLVEKKKKKKKKMVKGMVLVG